MSLDVYLKGNVTRKRSGSGIFIRENGQIVEISVEEWNRRFPDLSTPIVPEYEYESDTVFEYNITHNLWKMADAAGVYKHLWRPEEVGTTKAAQLIEPLRQGLAELRADPEKFKAFNPANGWGDYDNLVQFVAEYLAACEENPDATIHVSR